MRCELSCCLDVENPGLSNVTESVIQLIGFLRDVGVGDSVFLSEFELAAAEAINNAVEHGCAESEKKYFRARLYLRSEFVELRVLDPSSFKGWDTPPRLPDDPFDEGGRGHFLMSQMTDEITHEEEDGCHVLVLHKRFKTEQPSYVPGHADRLLSDMTDELVASYEMISTLLGLGEWLATAPDLDAFTSGALQKLCGVTGSEIAFVRVASPEGLVLVRQWGEALGVLPAVIPKPLTGVEGDVFLTGKEITLPMGTNLPPGDPLAGLMDSGFIAPVLFKEERRGILVMGRTNPSAFFEAGKLKIARVVAEYLGIVLMLSELQRRRAAEDRALRDLEIASQIQLSLMPPNSLQLPALDVHGVCRPALRTGGDYYDVLPLSDGSVIFTVADVMGKGLSAALLAAMLRTNLHAVLAGGESDPGRILTRINSLMSADLIKLEMFITISCVCISADRSQIRSSAAGHPPGFLVRKDGKVVELTGGGMPLGIFPTTRYESENGTFEVGDRLLLFTDGIVEASAPDGTLYDDKGLLAAFLAVRDQSCKDGVDGILSDLARFTENEAPSDDRTLILVARNS